MTNYFTFDIITNYFVFDIMKNYFIIDIMTNCTQTMQFPWNVKPVFCTEHPIWQDMSWLRGV